MPLSVCTLLFSTVKKNADGSRVTVVAPVRLGEQKSQTQQSQVFSQAPVEEPTRSKLSVNAASFIPAEQPSSTLETIPLSESPAVSSTVENQSAGNFINTIINATVINAYVFHCSYGNFV